MQLLVAATLLTTASLAARHGLSWDLSGANTKTEWTAQTVRDLRVFAPDVVSSNARALLSNEVGEIIRRFITISRG